MKVSGSGLDAAASNIIGKVIKLIVGLVIVAVVVVVALGIYFFFELGQRPSTREDTVLFSIAKGDSFGDITSRLYEGKLIRNPIVFRLRARIWQIESKVQAGTVTLRHNMTVDDVLEAITSARLNDREVRFQEGWRLEEYAQLLAQNGWDRDKFIKSVREDNWEFGFLNDKPPKASVEGFLFPDTYRIPANFSENQIVEMMLRRFGEQYNATLRQKARETNGIYKTVIMASIIEREAAKADERGKIASVFYNRLRLDMKFETDPTVSWARDSALYERDNTFTEWWKAPTKENLAIDSPYNTYKVKGFPPGPICNPSLASLRAATEPFSTEFLFFVATGERDGSHAFAKTVEEHNQNVKKYLGR